MIRYKLKIFYSVVLFFSLILSQLKGNSVENHFQKLPSPQYELLSNSITSIVQDEEVGFIWVGTRKGLFCYNGTEYREATTVNKYLSSALRLDITKLCFDIRGWLWIGTYKGVLVYDPKKDAIIEIDNTFRLRHVIVRDFFASTSGDVLIGSRNHLFTYNTQSMRIEDVTPNLRSRKLGYDPYYFYSFCEGKDSTIWLSSSYGLLNFDNRNINYQDYRFYPYQKSFGTDVVAGQQILLGISPDGNLLLGSDNGLYVLDLGKRKITPYTYTISSQYNKIRALTYDTNNRLWIGTLNGILVTENFKEPEYLTYQSEQFNSLSDDRVYALYTDKNNTVWVGTSHGGVNYWSERTTAFKHISDKGVGSLSHKNVNCISTDEKGNIYLGIAKMGVGLYDAKNQKFNKIINSNDHVSLGLQDMFVGDQTLWLATLSGGLVAYNQSSLELKRFLIDKSGAQTDLSFSNNILSVIQISKHKLLIGSFHHGINTFDIKSGEFKNIPIKGFKSPQRIVPAVQKIVKDGEGNIWLLVQDDVFRLNEDINSPSGYSAEQIFDGKVEDGWINDLCITKNNELWFSSHQGSVYNYSNGKFTQINFEHDIEVLTIVEGEDQSLWMSTTLGVFYYNYKTGKNRIFDERVGLEKNEFFPRAGIMANDGTIYLGGASGLTTFHPKNIIKSTNQNVRTQITGIWVYNNEISLNTNQSVLENPIAYANEIILGHKQNMFTLSFAPEDYSLNGPNSFEYRLLGFNDKWLKTSTPKVTYTLQSGGEYIFEVRYLNAQGVPSSKTRQLEITLLDPLWKTNLAIVFYIVVILLISWWLLSLYYTKTTLKHQLEIEAVEFQKQRELNEQKLRFFTNISHDFRTPLTLIIGTIEQFVKKFPLTNEMHQMLLSAQKSSNQLMSLINDLMDFRKLQNKQTSLSVSKRDIVLFVKEVYLSFSNQAEIHKYKYHFNSDVNELLVYFDATKLERILYNLLSNAFKFTDPGGEIAITIKNQNNQVEIVVSDTGCGIASEHLESIFDRFYEVKGVNTGFMKGAGIGLTIAKNFTELHKGNLTVKSKVNVGSAFTINFPLGKDHFAETDIVELQSELDVLKKSQLQLSYDDNRKIQAIVDDVLHKQDKKHNILIAEDDEDLGLFIKESLREYFNVRLENNGLKAYQSVLNNPPDLIISDVMMPVMTGIEFCSKIKNNSVTNYIPFVMLTARTAIVYKFEGLESGADEYLSKPFQIKELILKCANILTTQDNFRQTFINVPSTKLKDPKNNKTTEDNDYMKALSIINENIDNDAFGINDLCEKMGLSRSVLYSKIKEWTGQSPGELLLGFRMKKAATLLEQKKYTVAEVANKVGYKQATYFTKCFKNYYKMLPSEYVKKFC